MSRRHLAGPAASIVLGVGLLAAPAPCRGQPAAPDTALRVTWGAFVDSYYAYDFNAPPSFDRAFTTQPARHNEFNVNLAHVEAKLSGPRVRGRLALQAGTSVQSNYAAEPAHGAVSGPDVARFIQEAYAGYQVTQSLWVDGGVFFSNMGMESWISRDNPTYTRSLVADYSPYYSSGARLVWQATQRVTARLDVVNGWQNISETNSDKGVGARLDVALTPAATLSYYNFIGNETGARLRVFNGVGLDAALGERFRVLAQADVGAQEADDVGEDRSTWWGFTLVGQLQATELVAITGRVERFDDRDHVLIPTGGGMPGFRANGASLGVDVAPAARVLWRTEVRGFQSEDRVFPDRDAADALARRSALLVTSLSLTF